MKTKDIYLMANNLGHEPGIKCKCQPDSSQVGDKLVIVHKPIEEGEVPSLGEDIDDKTERIDENPLPKPNFALPVGGSSR